MAYTYVEFPKWLYHKDNPKKAVLVKDKEEETELGSDYVESPAVKQVKGKK